MRSNPNVGIVDPAKVFELFFAPGEVTELRAIGVSGKSEGWEGWARGDSVVFGYFDNGKSFVEAARVLEKARCPGIYFVLNPVNPSLLARSANRLRVADKKTPTSSDHDVVCLRWLYVDVDPVRPAGISSTDEELDEACRVRDEIAAFLEDPDRGFAVGIRAMSGNGAHLLIRLQEELPNDAEHVGRIKGCLAALQAKFGSEKVNVDEKVFNPARICKLYGTTARKGDNLPDRPHRRSYIKSVPEGILEPEGPRRDPSDPG
jgi:hypothetical protein